MDVLRCPHQDMEQLNARPKMLLLRGNVCVETGRAPRDGKEKAKVEED